MHIGMEKSNINVDNVGQVQGTSALKHQWINISARKRALTTKTKSDIQ